MDTYQLRSSLKDRPTDRDGDNLDVMMAGVNHHHTTLDALAAYIVPPERQTPLMDGLLHETAATEAVLLVTCNRCEIYLAVERYDHGIARRFASLATGMTEPDVRHLRVRTDLDAVRHLLLVASGCESMIIGETQILGQVKEAYRHARENGHAGTTLSRLFDHALATAKRVRQATGLDRHSTSFAGAALRLAGRLFEKLRDKNVLFIGTGDMIHSTAQQFIAREFKRLTFAGRSPDRASALAEELSGAARSIEEALDDLHQYDIVVCCTASRTPIITRSVVARALKRRHHRALCLIDLAVPHDVDPAAAHENDAYLFDLSHLADIVADSQRAHQNARTKAAELIEGSLHDYRLQIKECAATDLIKAWREEAEGIRVDAAAKAVRQLEEGHAPREVVQQLSRQLANKLLHPITGLIRHAAKTENIPLIRYLEDRFNMRDEK